MDIVGPFITALGRAVSFFWTIYHEVSGWVWPFYHAAYYFLQLSELCAWVSWKVADFGEWLDGFIAQVEGFLNWEAIRDFIISWFYWLEDLSAIFLYFWWNVWNVLTNWWADTSLLVQGWISEANAWLQSQINTLSWLLGNLQAAWDSFKGKIPSIDEIIAWFVDWWGNVVAAVINWGAITALQIQSLIESTIKSWFPFYESLAVLWDTVAEFITDPLEWLWARFLDWFLGPG